MRERQPNSKLAPMASHRIVAVRTEALHDHVIEVATAGPRGMIDWHWPLVEVLGASAAGESFYVVSPETGQRQEVDAAPCPVAGCSAMTVTSANGEGEDVLLGLDPRE